MVKDTQLQIINNCSFSWSLFLWEDIDLANMRMTGWSDLYGPSKQLSYLAVMNNAIFAYSKGYKLD